VVVNPCDSWGLSTADRFSTVEADLGEKASDLDEIVEISGE
jgi:hypothetical protein